MKDTLENEQGIICKRSIEDLVVMLNEISKAKEDENKLEYNKTLLKKNANHRIKQENYEVMNVKNRVNNTMIYKPIGELKIIQSDLKELLIKIGTESGMYESRISSLIENAKKHVGQNYMYKVVTLRYSEETHERRVSNRLIFEPYNFDKSCADMIASICCTKIEGKSKRFIVAKGAPTSRVLAYIVRDNLDRKMRGLAKRFNLIYTRYRNELIFSSKHNVYHEDGEFLKEVDRIIANQRFEYDKENSGLQKRGTRQEVKGLIITDKVNVKRNYVKGIRSMLYVLEKYGEEALESKLNEHKNWKNVLRGKLSYLRQVKGDDDAVYLKLKEQYDRIFNKDIQEI